MTRQPKAKRQGLENDLRKLIVVFNKICQSDSGNLHKITKNFLELFCKLEFRRGMDDNQLQIRQNSCAEWERSQFVRQFDRCLIESFSEAGFHVERNPRFVISNGQKKSGDLLIYKESEEPVRKVIFVEIKTTIEFNPMAAAIFQGILF